MTIDPAHPFHRPRRLDDYYSYTDDAWRQHPHYTITMLVVLGMLVAFIVGYALYQLGHMNQDDNLIKEVCSMGADDDLQRRQPLSKTDKIEMTTSYTQQKQRLDSDDYVTMPDVMRAVST